MEFLDSGIWAAELQLHAATEGPESAQQALSRHIFALVPVGEAVEEFGDSIRTF
jgi:hypothetical protein